MNELESELVEWQDVLGDGSFRRKTLKKVEDSNKDFQPQNNDLVCVEVKESLPSGDIVFEGERKFVIGDGDVISAYELGVKLMSVGETCLFDVSSRFCYGKLGNPPLVPSDSRIIIEMTLKSIDVCKNLNEYSSKEIIDACQAKKDRGNYWFQHEDFVNAINSYTKGLKILDNLHSLIKPKFESPVKNSDEEDLEDYQALYKEMYSNLFNNMAAAQLKANAYEGCIKSLKEVFRFKPNDIKALYRKSQALSHLGEIEKALNVLNQLKTLDPDNKAVLQDITRLRKQQIEHYKADKAMYSKMMNALVSNDQSLESEDFNLPQTNTWKFTKILEKILEYMKNEVFTCTFWTMAGFALMSLVLAFVGIKFNQWTMPPLPDPPIQPPRFEYHDDA